MLITVTLLVCVWSHQAKASDGKFSIGPSIQFGQQVYGSGDVGIYAFQWELDVISKYRLAKLFGLRAGLGIEYLTRTDRNHNRFSFNGEAGMELHFIQPDKYIDPFLFVGGGHPDTIHGGAGIKIGGNENISGFIEMNIGLRLISTIDLAYAGRFGVMFHF